MAEYIEREDVERLICSECCIGFCQKNMCRIINRLKEEIPAADVRDNVWGKWIDIANGRMKAWKRKCSQCGVYRRGKTNFCPDCGADMRPRDNE